MASEALLLQHPVTRRWLRADQRQRVTAYWRDVVQRDPELRTAHVTVELVLGGDQVVRVSTRALRTTSAWDGQEHAYLPGLVGEPEIDDDVELGQPGPAARTVTLTLPAYLIQPGELLARGRVLSGVGEVCLQVDGADFDDRLVLLRGVVAGGVRFGGDRRERARPNTSGLPATALGAGRGSETVELQLADPVATESLLIPGITVDSDRWSEAQDTAIGERYPEVFNGFTKVPALRVLNDHGSSGLYYLFARGHGWDVDAVYVNGVAKASGDATYAWAKLNAFDELGEAVTVIDFSGSAGPWADNDAVHVTCSRTNDAQLRSVVQVIEDVLRGYTSLGSGGVNPALFARARGAMPGFRPNVLVNGSGQDAARAMEWLSGGLLAAWPMVHLVFEGGGLGPVVIDRRAQRPEFALVAGEFPLRERGPYEETAAEAVFNEFEVAYGYDVITRAYAGVQTRNASNSAICQLSRELCGGRRPYQPMASPYVTTASQAAYVADWLAAHFAVPSYLVEWTCAPWAYMRLYRGMPVSYTDPLVGFSAVDATVVGLRYSREQGCAVRLRVWHPFWRADLSGLAGS